MDLSIVVPTRNRARNPQSLPFQLFDVVLSQAFHAAYQFEVFRQALLYLPSMFWLKLGSCIGSMMGAFVPDRVQHSRSS